MNTKVRFTLVLALVLLGGVALVAVTQAVPGNAPLAQGGAPAVVAYQGEVHVGVTPYAGEGYFKFAVVNSGGSTTYWSNDGTSSGGNPPTEVVTLTLTEGLFSVLLGDTTLDGMTQPLTADVFDQPDRYLRVWFSSDSITFDQLVPDTRIAAVPYALQAQEAADADTVDGLHASELGTHYLNRVVVAKSGGDYTSVQAAIDSITDAAADNPYLVWVAPGVYSETVTMKPHVHLQGAGQEVTVITSTASSGDWPPTQATLVLASDVSLRDLTVDNRGAGDSNVAIQATAGMTRTLAADVTARALGSGGSNFAIFLSGSGTGVTLQQATALAENGSSLNSGLFNYSGAQAVLHGGTYTARGGTNAKGIFNILTATLEATSVTALGENGSNLNTGLDNYNNSTAVLYGGDYTGRGGNQTGGAGASLNSTITAYGVYALAENGSGDVGNYAMASYNNSTATLSGGVFVARGGVNNYALCNELTATMKADNVTALAENGSSGNYGFWNVNNATAVVHGASFTGRGGSNAYGIYNSPGDTTLEIESVTALAENGSGFNYGLYNSGGAAATVRSGSLIGRGGAFTYGIYNVSGDTTLETESITALGDNGSINNFGLDNRAGAEAVLRSGSFTGSGGSSAYGILSSGITTTLEADSVTALGENGSLLSYGMENNNGGVATLRGGSFTGRGGNQASGVQNTVSSTLTAEGITALAENSSTENYGLLSYYGVTTTLRGGSFTGRGGTSAYGIYNSDSGARLEAANVTALGEDGSSDNYGLYNNDGVSAALHSCSFTARGGGTARGIFNSGSGTLLEATGVTALAEGGSTNYSLHQSDGTVRLGVTQLDGTVNWAGGSRTCFQVYDGSYAGISCP